MNIKNIKLLNRIISVAVALSVAFLFYETAFAGQPSGDVLATGSGRIILFAPDFSVKWEYPGGNVTEVHRLKNGNILFADKNVYEITPDKEVVFKWSPPAGKEGSYGAVRLENGNTLIGDNENGRILEIAPDGSIAFELQTRFETKDRHHRLRWIRKLKNGNYLVCHSGDRLVREYTPKGETVWEYKVPNIAFLAERLENGNTIISSLDQLTEVAPDKKVVWEFKTSDLPELGIRNMTGFQILKNGNIVIGCYAAYDKDGKGAGMFEITRNKKLVWAYQKGDAQKIDRSMMGVEVQE